MKSMRKERPGMINPNRLFGFLATGAVPEMTALDESLAEHDRKYHPKGFKDGDFCGIRASMSGSDDDDVLLSSPLTDAYEDALERNDMEACSRIVAEYANATMPNAVRDDGGFIKRIKVGPSGLSSENSPWNVNSMPDEMAEFIAGWDVISKSPYSDSYYSASGISWDHKPDRVIRVSDHWNFTHGGDLHCETDVPVEDVRTWAAAEYHKEDGRFHVLKTVKALGEYVPSDGFGFARMSAERKPQAANIYRGLEAAPSVGYTNTLRMLKGKHVKWRGLPNSGGTCIGFNGNKAVLKTASGKTIEVNAVALAMENRSSEADSSVFIDTKTGLVKSAAPVTYDDKGTVIPLGSRFNSSVNDINY